MSQINCADNSMLLSSIMTVVADMESVKNENSSEINKNLELWIDLLKKSIQTNNEVSNDKCDIRCKILSAVFSSLSKAYAKHGDDQWGRHEFYGILDEEFEEAKEVIFKDMDTNLLQGEIIQIIGVCIRYLETGDKYFGDFSF